MPGEKGAADELMLDRQICFAIQAASRAMTRAHQGPLQAMGLTYPQYLILMTLWPEDGLRVSDIGTRLRLDGGAMTPILKRMELQGLLGRHRSPSNEREVHICLTLEGKLCERMLSR